jgi:hypothetical protein
MSKLRDKLEEALEKFQEGGPYTHGTRAGADTMVYDILDDLKAEGVLDDEFRADVTTVFCGQETALIKLEIEVVPGENGEIVYLEVEDDELQFDDEYRVYISVENDPARLLDRQAERLAEQARSLMHDAENAATQAALLRGKTIKVVETGDNDITTNYMTDDEFLAHYRGWYEHERTWGEENPPAEEYLARVKAGEAEPVENHYYTKMTADWLGGKDE